MRTATAAALAFGRAEHARLGYPDDPEEFARGLKVRFIVGSDNYATDGPPAVISQRADSYAPRQRFTTFHETAHILIQRGDFERDILAEVDSDDAEQHLELVANHMASLFLIPDRLINHYIRKYGFTPEAVLKIRAAARASLAATSRRMVGFDEEQPTTILLSGQNYILDVASSDPWNRLRRYDRVPDVRSMFPDAHLLTLPGWRGHTLGVLQN